MMKYFMTLFLFNNCSGKATIYLCMEMNTGKKKKRADDKEHQYYKITRKHNPLQSTFLFQ